MILRLLNEFLKINFVILKHQDKKIPLIVKYYLKAPGPILGPFWTYLNGSNLVLRIWMGSGAKFGPARGSILGAGGSGSVPILGLSGGLLGPFWSVQGALGFRAHF